ncbi:MAG: heavy-metal-associated domain-containing protein [Algibacter sp.]
MKTILEIQNLKCGGCGNTIINKLSHLEHIIDVSIDVNNSAVIIESDNEDVIIKVKSLLKTIGYPVIGEKNALTTKAKSFVSCAIGRINK